MVVVVVVFFFLKGFIHILFFAWYYICHSQPSLHIGRDNSPYLGLKKWSTKHCYFHSSLQSTHDRSCVFLYICGACWGDAWVIFWRLSQGSFRKRSKGSLAKATFPSHYCRSNSSCAWMGSDFQPTCRRFFGPPIWNRSDLCPFLVRPAGSVRHLKPSVKPSCEALFLLVPYWGFQLGWCWVVF